MNADAHDPLGRSFGVSELFESKLHPPRARATSVRREELLDRLVASKEVQIASVVAPPGYGKTTLLAQWAERDCVAWLSVDHRDNDLSQLMSYALAALDRVEPVDPTFLQGPIRERSVASAAARLATAMSEMTQPVTLVLDHVEQLEEAECLDTVAELALHLPAGARLALATRSAPPLPMAKLRAAGALVEIGVDDLAMSPVDARALLSAAGADLHGADLEAVIERTEGWPVGLYLAALALQAGGAADRAGVAFSGDDRLMTEYLRSEILDYLSSQEIAFLTRTSVLERMTGSLCDAVLDTTGSGNRLDSLVRSNLLLVALDRTGEWFRYHHLLHDLLRSELDRREPQIVGELHKRAADWYEDHRFAEHTVDHAQAAGDANRVNRLVLANAQSAYGRGRIRMVERWLEWFDERGLVRYFPALAVSGAVLFSATGRVSEAERWAAAAELSVAETERDLSAVTGDDSDRHALPDGTTLASWRAFLRLTLCAGDLDGIRHDAEIAKSGLGPRSAYRAAVLVYEAFSYLFGGDIERADFVLAHALEVAADTGGVPAAVVAAAMRGAIAIGRNDWSAAEAFSGDALRAIETFGIYENAECSLAYALAARIAIHHHDTTTAHEYMARAARLRPMLNAARPLGSAYALLELSRVYVELYDAPGARELIRQAREVLRQRPSLGQLSDQVTALEAWIETMQTGTIGVSSLTAAELRLVPLLPTHLTYPQIGERLGVSRHTAKSQATSIYQKLGVSSRGDAVQRLTDLGLLEK